MISIDSIFGVFLIFYFMIEVSMIIVTKVPIFHKIYLYFRVYRQIRKIIPRWWSVRVSLLTMNKMNIPILKNYCEVYVKLTRKTDKEWTCDWIKVDFSGQIIEDFVHNLDQKCDEKDSFVGQEIKKWCRDKALEKLGI